MITRKNDAFDANIVNTRLTKIFIVIFAPDKRLPSSATLYRHNMVVGKASGSLNSPKYMFVGNILCFRCTFNILRMNPIEGPELRMNEWQGLLLLLTSEWPEASPTFPRGK